VFLTPDDDAEMDRRHDIAMDAAWAIIETEPTTIAGIIALLRYVADYEDRAIPFEFAVEDDDERKPWSFFIHHNLADALEKMKPRPGPTQDRRVQS
jgi:hypothetical protein